MWLLGEGHILIPRDSDYVILRGQKGLRRCDKVKDLEKGGIILDFLDGAHIITRVFMGEIRMPES